MCVDIMPDTTGDKFLVLGVGTAGMTTIWLPLLVCGSLSSSIGKLSKDVTMGGNDEHDDTLCSLLELNADDGPP